MIVPTDMTHLVGATGTSTTGLHSSQGGVSTTGRHVKDIHTQGWTDERIKLSPADIQMMAPTSIKHTGVIN